ncbi:MAG TPA: cupin domain-containing protein [Pyrinomonadaceae bacterium]|jgi:mannose-6-phosphate isomerase-like protein (cupin superfamily)
MKLSPEDFRAKLPLPADEKWKDGVWFTNAFRKGEFELEFFAPRGRDYQTPHEKDEFYIITSGAADLILNGAAIPCRTGDALFVAAGDEHHFENISEDFATWVIFFK